MTNDEDTVTIQAAPTDLEARPLDEGRLVHMRPAPAPDLKRRLPGRPRLQTPKHLVSLRLDLDILARFRATGPGWQARINQILRENLPEVTKQE